jgi:hypothetical protein
MDGNGRRPDLRRHFLGKPGIIRSGFEHYAISFSFGLTPRLRAPTEHRHRLSSDPVPPRDADVPERTAASVADSFHANIHGQHERK